MMNIKPYGGSKALREVAQRLKAVIEIVTDEEGDLRRAKIGERTGAFAAFC